MNRRSLLKAGIASALLTVTPSEAFSAVFNVKDYGAKGDALFGSGGLAGTDDTTAINAAIAAAGSGTLLFPDGAYIVQPGALTPITGSVIAPSALVVAANLSDQPIITLNYAETYPVQFGSGVTGLGAWRRFEMRQIIGGPDNAYKNIAIYCKSFDQSSIRIGNIRGCRIGIFLDGTTNNNHQGTNRIDFDEIYTCQCGILMWSGSAAGASCESNVVTGRYMYGFTDAAISLYGGGPTMKTNNDFRINSIGGVSPGTLYAAIVLDANCVHNRFDIMSWDNDDQPGAKNISSVGARNRFTVPTAIGCAVSSTDTLVVQ